MFGVAVPVPPLLVCLLEVWPLREGRVAGRLVLALDAGPDGANIIVPLETLR